MILMKCYYQLGMSVYSSHDFNEVLVMPWHSTDQRSRGTMNDVRSGAMTTFGTEWRRPWERSGAVFGAMYDVYSDR